MSRVWRVITTIVMVGLLLAVVCVTVGFMTGADFNRIFQSLDSRYMLSEYITWVQQAYAEVAGVMFG